MAKYSVVVAVYNAEKYIKQCIESVLNQTFSDFEFIIVNDGSKDGTTSIISEFVDDRILIFNQENHGAVYSRERGICAAKGEYVLFLDSDDWWDEDLLERVDKVICDTNADIIQFGYKFKDENGRDTVDAGLTKKGAFEETVVFEGLDSYAYTALKMCYSLWSRAIKRELFDTKQGFYETYYDVKMTNDLLGFSRPLSLSKRYCFTDFYPYNYRIVEDSMCHKVSIDKVDSYFKSITWAEKCLRDANGITDNHEIFFSERLAVLIFDEYREIIYGEAKGRIKETYDLAYKMPDLRRYLNKALSLEKDWYRKAFLKSFVNRRIIIPKLLIEYANIKNRKS